MVRDTVNLITSTIRLQLRQPLKMAKNPIKSNLLLVTYYLLLPRSGTRLIIIQSVTATAIKGEENLHPFLPPLQRKHTSCVSPNR